VEKKVLSIVKASIKLTKHFADYEFDPDINRGWGLLVRAEGTLIDSEIFVYHRMAESDPYEGDVFEAICSINQYYEIPAFEPVDTSDTETIPYFRRSQLEVFARSPEERDEIWDYIKGDVARLIKDFNSLNATKAHSTVTISGLTYQEDAQTDSELSTTLDWKPCGSWNGTTITEVDLSKKGWLPISEISNILDAPGGRIPDNALWFYNSQADTDFKNLFDRIGTPYSKNVMYRNGIPLSYGEGGFYEITSDGLYWLKPEDSTSGLPDNPWPSDYIDGIEVEVEPSLLLSVPVS